MRCLKSRRSKFPGAVCGYSESLRQLLACCWSLAALSWVCVCAAMVIAHFQPNGPADYFYHAVSLVAEHWGNEAFNYFNAAVRMDLTSHGVLQNELFENTIWACPKTVELPAKLCGFVKYIIAVLSIGSFADY